MKNITIILNIALLAVFGFASKAVMSPLYNRIVEYPTEHFKCQTLPPISNVLLQNMWIVWAIPSLWAILSVWVFFWKRTDEAHAIIHTSATLLIGIVMFFMYAMAGIFPFVGIIAHLK